MLFIFVPAVFPSEFMQENIYPFQNLYRGIYYAKYYGKGLIVVGKKIYGAGK